MLNKKNKKNTKKLLIYAVGALLLLVCLLAILEKTGVTNFINNDSTDITKVEDGPTPEEKEADDAINAANKQKSADADQETTPPVINNPDTTSNKVELSATQEGSTSVTVFTKLYDFSSGTCSLTVTNGGNSKTQTAAVFYQPEYSSCAGFSVPISGLGTGTWNINLKVDSNGTSSTKNISFKVT